MTIRPSHFDFSINTETPAILSSQYSPGARRLWSAQDSATEQTNNIVVPDNGTKFVSRTHENDIPQPVTANRRKRWWPRGLQINISKIWRRRTAKSGFDWTPLLFEFLGTTILYTGGFAGSLSVIAHSPSSYLAIPIAWGLAVMLAIYATVHGSGAHLNPGVSIMLATYGKFSWSKVIPYSLAQLLGAILGTAWGFCLQYKVLQAHFREVSMDHMEVSIGFYDLVISQGILYTQPDVHISIPIALLNEFSASFFLGIVILALDRNLVEKSSKTLAPFVMGLTITALAISFGANTDACLSPIRDLAPRIVAAIVGGRDGWKAFAIEAPDYGWYIWGPFGADIAGILAGARCFVWADRLHSCRARKTECDAEKKSLNRYGIEHQSHGLDGHQDDFTRIEASYIGQAL